MFSVGGYGGGVSTTKYIASRTCTQDGYKGIMDTLQKCTGSLALNVGLGSTVILQVYMNCPDKCYMYVICLH